MEKCNLIYAKFVRTDLKMFALDSAYKTFVI